MSDVSAVINYFATANEGFTTTLGTTISSGAATVPLNGVSGLTNGTVFVGIIEPGATNQQVFTGTVDTGGSQVTGVKWTRGTNVGHTSGVAIVDYTTGTVINMITAGMGKQHKQSGAHSAVTADSVAVTGNETVGGTLGVTGAVTHSSTTTLVGALTAAAIAMSGSLTGSGLASQLTTYSNPGSAGGTFYYINLAGIKLMWGTTTDLGTNTFSNNITMPSSFFSTMQFGIANTVHVGGTNDIYADIQSYGTTNAAIGIVASVGSGTATVGALFIGT